MTTTVTTRSWVLVLVLACCLGTACDSGGTRPRDPGSVAPDVLLSDGIEAETASDEAPSDPGPGETDVTETAEILADEGPDIVDPGTSSDPGTPPDPGPADPGDEPGADVAEPDGTVSDPGAGEPGVDVPILDDTSLPDPGADCGNACPPPADPGKPGGPAGSYKTYDLVLTGLPSKPTIELRIYLPAETGPHPVVVLLHGYQLGAALYASYGEHLASWGYVAILPQMPGSLVGGPNHKDLAVYLGKILDWIVGAAAQPDGVLEGKADGTRIGLAGHSLGGKIALLTASQDSRPAAVFGIDPVDSGSPLPSSPEDYPSVTPEKMGQIQIPIVLLGETTNATCSGLLCQPCAPADQNFHQYYVHAAGPALEIEVIGANHMSFLDNPNCGLTCSVCAKGKDDPATTRLLTRRAMTAFFQRVLREDAASATWLTGDEMAAQVAAGQVKVASKNGF